MNAEEEEEENWQQLFDWRDNAFYGYCSSVEKAMEVIQLFSYSTSTAYSVRRCSRKFGTFHPSGTA